MKRTLLTIMGVALALLYMGIPPVNGQGPNCPGEGERGRMRPEMERGERARQMIQSLKIWKVTELLDVDEKLAEKLYPRIREQERIRRESDEMIRDGIRAIQTELDKTPPNEQALKKAVDHFAALRMKIARRDQEALNRILELLTVEQRAKYLVLEEEFPRMIRKFLRNRGEGMGQESRRRHRRNPGMGQPVNPEDEFSPHPMHRE